MGNPEGNKEREGFADAINRAAFGNERVLLRRRGRAVAAVVPIDDLRLLEALEDRIDLLDARAALAQAEQAWRPIARCHFERIEALIAADDLRHFCGPSC